MNLIEPLTVFEKRLNQLDVRLTKRVRIGRARLDGMFDIYNLFNDDSVLNNNTRFGAAFLKPAQVMMDSKSQKACWGKLESRSESYLERNTHSNRYRRNRSNPLI